VRIGIHLGEVVFKENNVFGDGVNLASRVESLGVPGTVLFSKAVYEQIRNKSEFQAVSLGLFDFKNVEEPVEVYALQHADLLVPKRESLQGKLKLVAPESKRWYLRKKAIRFYRNLFGYLMLAWLAVELFALLVKKFDWDREFINLFILIACFGLMSTLIYTVFRRRWNWRAVSLQILCAALCGYTLFYYLLHPTAFNPDSMRLVRISQEEKGPLASLHSMAILPFGNLMNDSSQEYLLAGMHDGLISEIGKLGSIRIISRTSTLPYGNSTIGMNRIARELDVDAIMEGTITRADSTVDLRLKLVNVFPEEKTLWSESYSARFNELPKLYRAVTENVAREINQVLTPAEEQRLSTNDSVDGGAYKAYLKGRYYTGFLNREGFDKAEGFFRQALQIDPDYAPAYLGFAMLWMSKRQKYMVSPKVANPRIKEYLDKAMELDPNEPFLWASLGTYHFTTTYDWTASEAAFEKCIALNPNSAPGHNTYAHLLMILNRWEEAWEQMDYSMDLAPKSPWTLGFSAVMYGNSGKMLSSYKRWEELREIVPDNIMGLNADMMIQANLGQHDRAIGDLKKVLSEVGFGDLDGFIDKSYEQYGFKATLRAVAENLEARSDTTFVAPSFLIRFYGPLLHDEEKFMYYLQQMYESNDPDLGYYGIRNESNPLQKDPRYIAIMEKIGLW
jgi:TolB-like protein